MRGQLQNCPHVYFILFNIYIFLFIELPLYNKTVYVKDLNSEARLQQD